MDLVDLAEHLDRGDHVDNAYFAGLVDTLTSFLSPLTRMDLSSHTVRTRAKTNHVFT